MRSYSRFLCAVSLALIGALVLSCDDDENPVVAPADPCDDANTTCLTLTLLPTAMTYTSSGPDFDYGVSHNLSWEIDSKILAGYGPGQRLLITVIFDPPVVVRYAHINSQLGLGAGVPTTNFDLEAFGWGTAESTTWSNLGALAQFSGQSSSEALRLGVGVLFRTPLVTNSRLSQVTIDITVPETYSIAPVDGTPVLAGDLPVYSVWVGAYVPRGGTVGDPPMWQGEYEPQHLSQLPH